MTDSERYITGRTVQEQIRSIVKAVNDSGIADVKEAMEAVETKSASALSKAEIALSESATAITAAEGAQTAAQTAAADAAASAEDAADSLDLAQAASDRAGEAADDAAAAKAVILTYNTRLTAAEAKNTAQDTALANTVKKNETSKQSILGPLVAGSLKYIGPLPDLAEVDVETEIEDHEDRITALENASPGPSPDLSHYLKKDDTNAQTVTGPVNFDELKYKDGSAGYKSVGTKLGTIDDDITDHEERIQTLENGGADPPDLSHYLKKDDTNAQTVTGEVKFDNMKYKNNTLYTPIGTKLYELEQKDATQDASISSISTAVGGIGTAVEGIGTAVDEIRTSYLKLEKRTSTQVHIPQDVKTRVNLYTPYVDYHQNGHSDITAHDWKPLGQRMFLMDRDITNLNASDTGENYKRRYDADRGEALPPQIIEGDTLVKWWRATEGEDPPVKGATVSIHETAEVKYIPQNCPRHSWSGTATYRSRGPKICADDGTPLAEINTGWAYNDDMSARLGFASLVLTVPIPDYDDANKKVYRAELAIAIKSDGYGYLFCGPYGTAMKYGAPVKTFQMDESDDPYIYGDENK